MGGRGGWGAEKAGEEGLAVGCDGPKGRSSRNPKGFEQEFEHRKVREKRVSTISAGAGGVVGGVVAVIVRVLGGG